MRKTLTALVVILLLIILVQNSHAVSVHFLLWDFTLPQIVLLLLTALTGVLVGMSVGLTKRRTGRARSAQSPAPK